MNSSKLVVHSGTGAELPSDIQVKLDHKRQQRIHSEQKNQRILFQSEAPHQIHDKSRFDYCFNAIR